jgi:hypothetical protein
MIRRDLAERLRARRRELEEAIITRLCDMSDPNHHVDAEYVSSLRTAIAESTEDALLGIEKGDDWPGSWPPATAAHARRMARIGVSLDTSLRRGAAAERVREEFLMDEAAGVPCSALREILRSRGLQFDCLLASFAKEYRREAARVLGSPDQMRGELVRRLLDGAPAEVSELGYELDAWHLGIIATGAGAGKVVRRGRMTADFQLLSVLRDNETAWAWLGGRRRVTSTEIQHAWPPEELARISLAIGEPGHGIDGWRLTHRQAQAAQWVALHRPGKLTRYADELLLVAALKDEVLGRSLRETYLFPLHTGGDADGSAGPTLRAYFASGCNAATAAAALHVDRHTVHRRLRRIEERLGRSIYNCRSELEVALRLEEFGRARTDQQLDTPPKRPEAARSLAGVVD